MHWPDPAQRNRIAEIRDNLTARIAEADREGWLGEAEGLKISLAGAQDKLAQIDRRNRTPASVGLGMPALSRTPRPELNTRNQPRLHDHFPSSGKAEMSALTTCMPMH